MKKWAFALSAAILVAAGPAIAWNGRGHMIVAAKAWEHLTPQTRLRVGELLRHNPMYATWTAGVPAGDEARVAFIRAATWPDAIRNAPGYVDGEVTEPNARNNTGYDDCARHTYWHFKDIPFSPDHSATVPPPEPDAETQIIAFAAVLGDAGAGDELKAYDLVWLIHLVGDVHQPLHATTRFVASDRTFPPGDRGGNQVKVCLRAGCKGSPLHTFWDHAFGDANDIASVTTFAASLAAPNAAQAANLVPAAWIDESFRLARSQVYRSPIGNGLGPFTLTSSYRTNAARVATRQVSLAGVRLARLIEGAQLQTRGDPVRPSPCH